MRLYNRTSKIKAFQSFPFVVNSQWSIGLFTKVSPHGGAAFCLTKRERASQCIQPCQMPFYTPVLKALTNILTYLQSFYVMDSDNANTKSGAERKQLREIYHTAFLLRMVLVPDVVPSILEYAGLFERHTNSSVRQQPLTITENSAPTTVLVTSAIRSSARLQNPVRKVVFAIQSSDQGCR